MAPLFLDPISLLALLIREETDVILPADVAYMASAEACLAQPDALLARQRDLSEVEDFLYAQFHSATHADQRVVLYDSAGRSIEAAQRRNRRNYYNMLQRRSEPLVFEVKPGDLVLVSGRPRNGLAPKFLGPFRVVRLTASGNVVVATDDSGTLRPLQLLWKVKPSWLYPCRYTHQCHDARPTTKESHHVSVATAGPGGPFV